MSLVSLLEELNSADEEMNKEASEMQKLAAEEDAAGRITARGFMDELQKLAADGDYGKVFKNMPGPGDAPKTPKAPASVPKAPAFGAYKKVFKNTNSPVAK